MSDTPGGKDWWQAANGKWYHPKRAPGDQFDGRSPVQWPTRKKTNPLPTEPTPEMKQAAWIGIVGGAVAIVSAFLPWMTAVEFYGALNRNAFQMGNNLSFSWDGLAILFLGGVSIGIGLSRLKQFRMPGGLATSAVWPGIGLAALVFVDAGSIRHWIDSHSGSGATLGMGYGLYIAGAAALAIFASGATLHRLDKS